MGDSSADDSLNPLTEARPERVNPPRSETNMRSPWIYRLGILAALMLAGGAGIKWPYPHLLELRSDDTRPRPGAFHHGGRGPNGHGRRAVRPRRYVLDVPAPEPAHRPRPRARPGRQAVAARRGPVPGLVDRAALARRAA